MYSDKSPGADEMLRWYSVIWRQMAVVVTSNAIKREATATESIQAKAFPYLNEIKTENLAERGLQYCVVSAVMFFRIRCTVKL